VISILYFIKISLVVLVLKCGYMARLHSPKWANFMDSAKTTGKSLKN
jgi:hypothetical protein